MAFNIVWLLLLLWVGCCHCHGQYAVKSSLTVGSLLNGRRLKQIAPAILTIDTEEPVSATTADLTNDPAGRGHLLVRAIHL